MVRSPNGLWVFDKNTGDRVMRRLSNPSLDVPSFSQILNNFEEYLSAIIEILPYLSDDQLVEAFNYATTLGKQSWMIRASILYETQQRSSYGEHALESIASLFGISRRQAWKYVQVWKAFFAGNREDMKSSNFETFSFDEPSWYVVSATETNDPGKWLSYAQDRKAEDPRYSVSRFRQDIIEARPLGQPTNGYIPQGSQDTIVDLPRLEHSTCPWIRRMCVKSGRPVPFEECRDCEFNDGTADG